jgi:hypothetical protein
VLRARDVERAAAFYREIMGWTVFAVPGNSGHHFFQVGGKTVASLHPTSLGKDVWAPCVSVEDLETTTSAAVALGATLIDKVDVPGIARMATLRDSEDTIFGLWEPAPNEGAELVNERGSLWWIEVLSNNVAAARNLYCRLLGWIPQETSFEPFASYTFLKRGEVHESGILPIEKDWKIQPRWNSIFAVDDCDATIAHAIRLGGRHEFIHTVPNAGRVGVVTDPGGAFFLARGPTRNNSGLVSEFFVWKTLTLP